MVDNLNTKGDTIIHDVQEDVEMDKMKEDDSAGNSIIMTNEPGEVNIIVDSDKDVRETLAYTIDQVELNNIMNDTSEVSYFNLSVAISYNIRTCLKKKKKNVKKVLKI